MWTERGWQMRSQSWLLFSRSSTVGIIQQCASCERERDRDGEGRASTAERDEGGPGGGGSRSVRLPLLPSGFQALPRACTGSLGPTPPRTPQRWRQSDVASRCFFCRCPSKWRSVTRENAPKSHHLFVPHLRYLDELWFHFDQSIVDVTFYLSGSKSKHLLFSAVISHFVHKKKVSTLWMNSWKLLNLLFCNLGIISSQRKNWLGITWGFTWCHHMWRMWDTDTISSGMTRELELAWFFVGHKIPDFKNKWLFEE